MSVIEDPGSFRPALFMIMQEILRKCSQTSVGSLKLGQGYRSTAKVLGSNPIKVKELCCFTMV